MTGPQKDEVDFLISELELRVDRLRALYDQYFSGLEKLEPLVPRKDVERRFEVLRRMQLRNTGQRFRVQTLQQRYNTYQTYWQRLCRQIELGTFKRDIRRAKERFGEPTPAAALRSARGLESMAPEAPTGSGRLLDPADVEAAFEDLLGSAPVADVPPAVSSTAAAASVAPAKTSAAPTGGPSKPPPLPARATGGAASANSLAARSAAAPAAAAPTAATQRAPVPAPSPSRPSARPPAPRPPPADGARRMVVVRAKASATGAAPSPGPSRPEATPPVHAAPSPSAPIPQRRLEELYTQYVSAKRSRGESTQGLTVEGLAESLRKSSERLKERSGAGKSVDFEVTEKDGKTVIRPVLK